MPRQPRLDAPGTLHHVIARGIERRKIFVEDADYEDFATRLQAVVSRGRGAEVFAWSLIPNHFHLLIRTGDVGLPGIMRRLMTGYAVAFNRRHRRHGHLFQNRYKSILCEEEVYLLELVRYIHLNPLRARLARDMEQLADYPWSGHAALLGRVERPWQAVEAVLARFGSEKALARAGYERFVSEGMRQGRRPDLVGGGLRRSSGAISEAPRRRRRKEEEPVAFDERILGSSDFVRAVLNDAEWEAREKLRRAARGVTIEELATLTAQLAGVSLSDLRAATRRPAVVAARRALAQVAVSELGKTGALVARYLGVATSTVNRHAAAGEASPLGKMLLESIRKEV
jgi:REP element-mobilizing transposase RayT